jgi:hypothetical protein
MQPMAVTHDAVAAIRQFQLLPHGDEGVGLGDQHLSQHSAVTFRSAPRSGNALALGRRLSRPLFGEPGEFLGEAICIDVLGIEVVSDPFAEVGVAFMLGIVDGLEELGVAPGATDVLGGGTTSDGLDQARTEHGIASNVPISRPAVPCRPLTLIVAAAATVSARRESLR